MNLNNSQCIIIKIGSSLLVDGAKLAINQQWLESLVADVVALIQQGKKIVLVSSGAIAFGRITAKLKTRPTALDLKQAMAAVGQVQLMHTYQTAFAAHELNVAQVLLTMEDTEDRQRFINLRNTLNTLFSLNIVPIINENDSVTTAEIRYGDNDRLAARVIQMVDADTLVLLSDIDGLYTDDPRVNPHATLIPSVENVDNKIMHMAKNSGCNFGSGGMITKLEAAKIAVSSGCNMLITAGKHLFPLTHFLRHQVGTWFHAHMTAQNAKKTWLQQHLKPMGTIIIDEGAVKALKKGASLLAIGISRVESHFPKGAAVEIVDSKKRTLARGLTNFSSNDMHKIIGKHSDEFSTLLGYETGDTVIHRDNLVLL